MIDYFLEVYREFAVGAKREQDYCLQEGFLITENEIFEYALLEKEGEFMDVAGVKKETDVFIPVVVLPKEVKGIHVFTGIRGIAPYFTLLKKNVKKMKQKRDEILVDFPNHNYIEGEHLGVSFYDPEYWKKKFKQIHNFVTDFLEELVESMKFSPKTKENILKYNSQSPYCLTFCKDCAFKLKNLIINTFVKHQDYIHTTDVSVTELLSCVSGIYAENYLYQKLAGINCHVCNQLKAGPPLNNMSYEEQTKLHKLF